MKIQVCSSTKIAKAMIENKLTLKINFITSITNPKLQLLIQQYQSEYFIHRLKIVLEISLDNNMIPKIATSRNLI